ncbi:DinB family protein [Agrobacterium vitis]|uniref:DinB family protein n=1 Tax=Agrobacterium vitis TaxID=373 RepID=UPI001574A789|nr:DinB family protein [Agrobacterium vitis]NSZ16272.1 DUF664 domain-containing protein [Agrobacterium vitis]QZO05033.1 DinB family protein [Agrobacterium vitis]UJL87180.1 DinB family protein [Agrobacterium vitis]
MIDHWTMFVAYNDWANQKIYEVAAVLNEEELHRDTGAFFQSLFGTLTHIVVADHVWLQRMTGEGPTHQRLDERPCADLAALADERRATDARIVAYCATLTPERLADDIEYRPMTTPDLVRHNLGKALAHMFNHQTHHRGQAHMILTVLGKPSLSLDLAPFQRLQKPA